MTDPMDDAALYNEIEPFAADWLENLIAAGKIAPGVVDRRSIMDLDPDYVRRFRQVHLFAGIGIWSGALRGAGWPDDRRILTGSCPCQPFSAAGQGGGFDDERHLWPAMFQLAVQCDFDVIVGEQVASKDGLAWFDLVRSDLEGADYAVGVVDMCAAGFGAPHIRQRLNWVAVANARGDGPQRWLSGRPDAQRQTLDGPAGRDGSTGGGLRLDDAASSRHVGPIGNPERDTRDETRLRVPDAGREIGGLADTVRGGAGPDAGDGAGAQGPIDGQHGHTPGSGAPQGERVAPGGLALPDDAQRRTDLAGGDDRGGSDAGRTQGPGHARAGGEDQRAGPVNGGWAAADWLHCRDGRWRPVEPGTFPLAHALPKSMGAMGAGLAGMAAMAGADKSSLATAKRFRTGTLRGFGNAVVWEQTQAFCEIVLEVVG